MARINKKDGKKDKKDESDSGIIGNYLQEETVRAIAAVGFFVLALFLLLSAFGKGGVVGIKSFEMFLKASASAK